MLEALATGNDAEIALESLWRNESVQQIAQKLKQNGRRASEDENAAVSSDAETVQGQLDDEDDGLAGKDSKERDNVQRYEQLEKGNPLNPSSADDCQPPRSTMSFNRTSETRDDTDNLPRQHRLGSTGGPQNSVKCALQVENQRVPADGHYPSPPFAVGIETTAGAITYRVHPTTSTLLGENPAGPSASGIWDASGLQVLPYEFVQNVFSVFGRQYVPFPTIQKDLFMRDFHQGSRVHCSSALLRSIACLACRVLGGYKSSASSHAILGDRLYAETRQLLASTDPDEYSIPDAQALGNLALHQLGLGEYADARALADESVRRIDITYRNQNIEEKVMPEHATTALFGIISFAR